MSEPSLEEPDAIDLLLPFHATGRLSASERAQIEAALARDPDVARRLAIVDAERTETNAHNAGLGAPSRRSRDALFARIDADIARRQPLSRNWLARLGERLAGLSPPALAGLSLAACLLILVQAGLLGGLLLPRAPATSYETASHRDAAARFALVAFAPTAKASEIEDALRAVGATIVEGPRPGGLYRIRFSTERMPAQATLERLRDQAGLLKFGALEGAP